MMSVFIISQLQISSNGGSFLPPAAEENGAIEHSTFEQWRRARLRSNLDFLLVKTFLAQGFSSFILANLLDNYIKRVIFIVRLTLHMLGLYYG